MTQQKLSTDSSPEIICDNFFEKEPILEIEEIDEVTEGAAGFLTLITVCEFLFLLSLTIGLVLKLPRLSPIGIVLICHSFNRYFKKLKTLSDSSEH
jgi:hypothetical protein